MADWEDWMSHGRSLGGGRFSKDEDFDEDDVWDADREKQDDSSSKLWKSYELSGSSSAWNSHSDPRTIPLANAATGHEGKLARGSSAPRDIPDWSKIYGVRNAGKGSGSQTYRDGSGTTEDGDGGDEDDDRVPPHEWIARKLSRSQISSFSVCEGVGRTLKGRDLSKVRNAVLSKTGFIE